MAVTSAEAVANEFLDLGWSENGNPPIDQMKLQKLLYYAHAWYLAFYNKPLFDEDLEAWPWGPVVRDIYIKTKQFGRAPITQHIAELELADNDARNAQFVTKKVDDPEIKDFIRAVWESHKALSGIQLSNSTHAEGEPWTIVKEKYGSLEDKPTIPNDLIKVIFKTKLADENAQDTAA